MRLTEYNTILHTTYVYIIPLIMLSDLHKYLNIQHISRTIIKYFIFHLRNLVLHDISFQTLAVVASDLSSTSQQVLYVWAY